MPYKDKDVQREYQRVRQQQNKIKYREIVSKMFGGKCQAPDCGYDKSIFAFQLDHINPVLRKKGVKDETSQMWRKVALGKVSMEGLQMLCANCHWIKTIQVDMKTYKFVGRPKNK